jgi:hypothetical protein
VVGVSVVEVRKKGTVGGGIALGSGEVDVRRAVDEVKFESGPITLWRPKCCLNSAALGSALRSRKIGPCENQRH